MGKESSTDISTKENLDRLVQLGEQLLKKPVARVNLDTGLSEPILNGGTNEEALKKYVKLINCCTHAMHPNLSNFYVVKIIVL